MNTVNNIAAMAAQAKAASIANAKRAQFVLQRQLLQANAATADAQRGREEAEGRLAAVQKELAEARAAAARMEAQVKRLTESLNEALAKKDKKPKKQEKAEAAADSAAV